MDRWILLFVFTALLSSVSGQCSLSDLRCCLDEFGSFVSPAGISLSIQSLARVCTIKDETVECMELFRDQCLRNETENDQEALRNIVNKTAAFIDDVCPPTSEFVTNLKSHEACILSSSKSFQACYNKTVTPDSENSDTKQAKKTDCCEYKNLRNCAVQTVEDKCGATASQLVHTHVVSINGAVLEWACDTTFGECGNSAVMLASSVFFVLCKIALLKFLLL